MNSYFYSLHMAIGYGLPYIRPWCSGVTRWWLLRDLADEENQ